jgi:hypothetical protein
MCQGWAVRPSSLFSEHAQAALFDTRLCSMDPEPNGRQQAGSRDFGTA